MPLTVDSVHTKRLRIDPIIMRERDIKKNDKTVDTHERSESQIRRDIAAKRAEVEELRRRNKVYEDNKHKLDVSIGI